MMLDRKLTTTPVNSEAVFAGVWIEGGDNSESVDSEDSVDTNEGVDGNEGVM